MNDAQEIALVKSRYCIASEMLRRQRREAARIFVEILHDDATARYGAAEEMDKCAIIRFAVREVHERFYSMHHHIGDHSVTVDGDRAAGTWISRLSMYDPQRRNIVFRVGRFVDEFIRVGGCWKISSIEWHDIPAWDYMVKDQQSNGTGADEIWRSSPGLARREDFQISA